MRIAVCGVRAVVVGAVVAVAPLAVSAPAYADQTDDAFIAALNSHDVPYKSPEDAIRVAKKVCTLLGASPGKKGLQGAVTYLSKFTNYSQDQMGLFGAAAIGAYCPENNPNRAASEG